MGRPQIHLSNNLLVLGGNLVPGAIGAATFAARSIS
jgi:hypothetical protein